MDNNDILIRLRYALDIKNSDMVEIFKLGGIQLTKEEVLKMLTKSNNSQDHETDNSGDIAGSEENITCNDRMLESFLNGFFFYKIIKQKTKKMQPTKTVMCK